MAERHCHAEAVGFLDDGDAELGEAAAGDLVVVAIGQLVAPVVGEVQVAHAQAEEGAEEVQAAVRGPAGGVVLLEGVAAFDLHDEAQRARLGALGVGQVALVEDDGGAGDLADLVEEQVHHVQ